VQLRPPWTEAMLKTLRAGPCSREDLVNQVYLLVDPSQAYRQAVARQKRQRSRRTNPKESTYSVALLVASGQRYIANGAFYGLVRWGTISHKNGMASLIKK